MDAALRQIIDRVRDSADRRSAVRICGGGTKDFHGPGAPQHAGEPLDMRPLAGVVSYEPSELVVTALAGTPLAELEALLARHGQSLPFEPPRFAEGGTVGGMVAAGLSGPARASVGAVRDYVLGVEIINGRGELLRFGGQVMKNVAGYDVSRLMAGAWGQLGVITEVSLKVLPFAPAEATLRFDCDQAEALAGLNAGGGQPRPLNASCWMDGLLAVRLRGAKAAVEAASRTMGGELVDMLDGWQAFRDQRLPWFTERREGHALWRLSVPQTAPVLDLSEGIAPPLVEWHGGLRWVQAAPEHAAALQALAAQAGGNASLFIAAGADGESAGAGFDPNSALAAIHQRLKRAFDPAGIFNPEAAAP